MNGDLVLTEGPVIIVLCFILIKKVVTNSTFAADDVRAGFSVKVMFESLRFPLLFSLSKESAEDN